MLFPGAIPSTCINVVCVSTITVPKLPYPALDPPSKAANRDRVSKLLCTLLISPSGTLDFQCFSIFCCHSGKLKGSYQTTLSVWSNSFEFAVCIYMIAMPFIYGYSSIRRTYVR